jgi:uncharacterized protein (TIGR02145 family)
MKKRIIYVVILLFNGYMAQAQIGIGTSSPNSNAILDLTSSQKGLLLPRVASTSVILNPVNGLLIYDLSSNCLKAFENGAWTDCGLVQIPSIVALDCSSDFSPSSAKYTIAYSGATTTDYTGGNGAVYTSASYTSTGVTGLTLTLTAGTLAIGSGTLSYTVSGTPSAAGTATFSISFLGKTCTKAISVYACGAYVATGVYKEFMCHNLGADISLDPDIPVQGINGSYYQWGRKEAVADAYTTGKINGWNIIDAADGSWSESSKTINDPCPSGYRIPTKDEWKGVADQTLNTITYTESWSYSLSNYYTSAVHFGTGSRKTLTLIPAGMRFAYDGKLSGIGTGYYWSSSPHHGNIPGVKYSWVMYFNEGFVSNDDSLNTFGFRIAALPIRCIAE